MPKTKKDSSSSDSGPDDRTPVKKAKPSTPAEPAEESFELNGNKRTVKVCQFRNRVYVNIREYYEKDGKFCPSKTGISLTVPEWKKLLEHADAITEMTKKF